MAVRLRTASSCGEKRRRPEAERWGVSRRLPLNPCGRADLKVGLYNSVEALRWCRGRPSGRPGLTGFFDQRDRLVFRFDDLARDDDLTQLLLTWYRVHQVEHQVFDDHAQAAGADLARQR